MEISNNVRWSKNKLLSFNKLWSFVIGARAVGKTFAAKKWAIDDYIKKGGKTVWVMRWKTEVEEVTKDGKFFDDIREFYPNYDFKIEGKHTAFIKKLDPNIPDTEIPWERFITFKALSERALKAISDPSVTKMIFDEFLPIPGVPYLSNEVERFLEFYFTISRDRPLRALFIGNNVTTASPYFSYFNVKLPREGEFFIADEIAIENCKNEPFKQAMRNTRFGNLVKGTKYAKYAIENESFVDLNTFVMDKPKNAKCIIRLSSAMGDLYLWTAQPAALFISTSGDPNLPVWALDERSHNEHSERVDFASSMASHLIKQHYRGGTLFFDSSDAKAIFQTVGDKLLY